MNDIKKTQMPSLYDDLTPHTALKILHKNKNDYVSRKIVWFVAALSFCIGVVSALLLFWLTLQPANEETITTQANKHTTPLVNSGSNTATKNLNLPESQVNPVVMPPRIISSHPDKLSPASTHKPSFAQQPEPPVKAETGSSAVKSKGTTNPFKILETEPAKPAKPDQIELLIIQLNKSSKTSTSIQHSTQKTNAKTINKAS